MRRNLTILSFLVIALIAVALPLQAKFLGDLGYLLFGGTRRYTYPGVTVSLTSRVSATMVSNLAMTYQPIDSEKAVVMKGTELLIDVLILAGRDDGREFVIAVSDPEKTVKSPDLKGRLPRTRFGGMNILGRFRGVYGQAKWDTGCASQGVHYVYIFVYKGGEYQPVGENGTPIWLGPSLDEIERGGLDNISADDLRALGLQKQTEVVMPAPRYEPSPTVEEVCEPAGRVLEDEPVAKVAMTLVLWGKSQKRILMKVSLDCKLFVGQKVFFKRNGDLIAEAYVSDIVGNVVKANLHRLFAGPLRIGDKVELERGDVR